MRILLHAATLREYAEPDFTEPQRNTTPQREEHSPRAQKLNPPHPKPAANARYASLSQLCYC